MLKSKVGSPRNLQAPGLAWGGIGKSIWEEPRPPQPAPPPRPAPPRPQEGVLGHPGALLFRL